jgi:hypothetical protein
VEYDDLRSCLLRTEILLNRVSSFHNLRIVLNLGVLKTFLVESEARVHLINRPAKQQP